jgi:hypothetical protein
MLFVFVSMPNNGLTGTFSWINPYGRPFFLIKRRYRGLSGIFSGIITSSCSLCEVYQERLQPDICQAGWMRAV